MNKIILTYDDFPLAFERPDCWSLDKTYNLIEEVQNKRGIKGCVGFFNGNILDGKPELRSLLSRWVESGNFIGNHTYHHLGLHDTDIDDFIEDVKLNEDAITKAIPAGGNIHAFRFPYLQEGRDQSEWLSIKNRLADMSLSVSLASAGFQDYLWNPYFVKAINEGNDELLQRVKKDFLRNVSIRLSNTKNFCNNPKMYIENFQHVALLHFCPLVAYLLHEIVDLVIQNGFEIISNQDFTEANYLSPLNYLHMRLGSETMKLADYKDINLDY